MEKNHPHYIVRPVTGKSSAERWARSLEQELLAQLLAPEPEPETPGPGAR